MNSNNFDFKLVKETKNKSNINYKTIRVTSKTKKMINIKELDNIYKYMLDKKNITSNKIKMVAKHRGNLKPDDVAIKGMNDIFRTIKTFEDDGIKSYDDYDEEYLTNKTLSKKKMNNFYFVDITIEV